jgi:hypothetical protein
MDYQQKYLKYKNKYLQLKEQMGGENNIKEIIKDFTEYINNNPNGEKAIDILSSKDKKNQIDSYKNIINKLNPKQKQQLLWSYNKDTVYKNIDIFNKYISIISDNSINDFDEKKTKMFFKILEQIFLKMSQKKEYDILKQNYVSVKEILKYIIKNNLHKQPDFTDDKQELFGNILGELCDRDKINIITDTVDDNKRKYAYYIIIIHIIDIINVISKGIFKIFTDNQIKIIADFYYSIDKDRMYEFDYEKIYALIDYIHKNESSFKGNKNDEYYKDKINKIDEYYIKIQTEKLNKLLSDENELKKINSFIDQLNNNIKSYNNGNKFQINDVYTEINPIGYGRTLNTSMDSINNKLKEINPLLDHYLNFPLNDVYSYGLYGDHTFAKTANNTDKQKQNMVMNLNDEYRKPIHHHREFPLLTKDSFKVKAK